MKNNYYLEKPRIDLIIIWGHGLKFQEEIIKEIENEDQFEIKYIIKLNPRNIKTIIKKVYYFDYAPLAHLKDKTHYLQNVNNEICIVVLNNLKPQEEYFGENEFRHIESINLKNLKTKIRNKFNPIISGLISHNHVIHATDNENQSDYFLKYIGYKNGVKDFKKETSFLNIPPYLITQKNLLIRKIEIKNLYCSIAVGDSWNSYELKLKHINESPQFKFINGDKKTYIEYLNKFLGGPIKSYHSEKKFQTLIRNQTKENKNNYLITVKKINDTDYLILDGLHRASICLFKNYKTILACIIN